MAAGPTYEPIATATLTSGAASISFSSISGSYTDLRLIIITASGGGNGNISLTLNGSGTGYSRTYIQGDGATAISGQSLSTIRLPVGNINSTNVCMSEVDIFSYAGSTFKTLLYKGSADANGSGTIQAGVDLWQNTAAITSIQIVNDYAGNFPVGTVATLYGITKA